MNKRYAKAYKTLDEMGVPVFNKYSGGGPIEEGRFKISAESDGNYIIDYYMPGVGEFGVDQPICDVLRDNGLMCEWENPGCLCVYEI